MRFRAAFVVTAWASSVGLLSAASARAASLQKVTDWGASGVPSTASMYVYVPDTLAKKPPILVVAHFCGGSASAVFGQAQGGGIVKAADQYGFILVVPQTSKNCWDVGSTQALKHDGGGDTQAIAQMVKYAITKYSANADRVYATGDSSGGMMTQGLMAVYPDVFKGGSAFAGVPAGCWAVGDPDGSWSNQCAGGTVTHTAKEWGDLARGMYPTYTGHRPRVQLFHGDADPTIKYPNFTESIKQWTDVLGLATAPTTTDTVTLGSHQATRQQWKNACGYVVLDAFNSKGGDHGPSDAIFNASFVVPFLGLDKPDAVDPELAACGVATGGSGTGGAAAGGASGAGSGGGTALGGAPSSGTAGSGGNGSAGTPAVGAGAAGMLGVGGSSGAAPSGTGGALASGAAAGAITSGGSGAVAGESQSSSANAPDNGGCSCGVARRASPVAGWAALLLSALLFRRRREWAERSR